MSSIHRTSVSPAETRMVAAGLAAVCRAGDVIALVGPLGAGKTCFIQGLAEGLGVPKEAYVNSPTFILLNCYCGRLPLYHFDWYRLRGPEELGALGPEEYFDGEGITVVEWADKFPPGDM
ncbi:MAG: tRNA (adenosine(37)-N6)-threonylcarbamoyltransferase complex ATPase subunit type 1 TsaE [Deltaproteobacteria bacterium]|nr:tRNA (adenosine(37)-N6)-threonylcarbamoyltransferase complex ATPase subunit type 1 TsaE [Deltaproteobacteria bacterium]